MAMKMPKSKSRIYEYKTNETLIGMGGAHRIAADGADTDGRDDDDDDGDEYVEGERRFGAQIVKFDD